MANIIHNAVTIYVPKPALSKVVKVGMKGTQGIEGKSAYAIAVGNGFEGTEADWLRSLKGDAFEYSDFTAEQLHGLIGPKGDKGDPFAIYKTYSSIAEMEADAEHVADGLFVMITSLPEDEDNAKLYVKSTNNFIFITDLSGMQGIKGDQGPQGPQGPEGPAGAPVVTVVIQDTDAPENSVITVPEHAPGCLQVYYDGLLLSAGQNYTETTTTEITVLFAVESGAVWEFHVFVAQGEMNNGT